MIGLCEECGSEDPRSRSSALPPWTVCGSCTRAWGTDAEGRELGWWVEEVGTRAPGRWMIWESAAVDPFVREAVDIFATHHEAVLFLEERLASYATTLPDSGSYNE